MVQLELAHKMINIVRHKRHFSQTVIIPFIQQLHQKKNNL